MKIAQLDHITITAQNPERSISFYRDVLGLVPAYQWAGEITMLKAGDTFLAIAHWARDKKDSRQPPITVDHFAFRVDRQSYESAAAELRQKGIAMDHESDHGICRSLYFRDPDGHLVELTCYELVGDSTKMPQKL